MGTITIGGVSAELGRRVSRMVPIAAGSDPGVEIPVTVARGGPGPVVALIAGNHGYEYPPILALQRLLPRMVPGELHGTVVMVHVAAMPSFQKRTVYVSPIDGKNLNRAYPGDPQGTSSERIAHFLTREVIEKADAVLDLHGGDGNESLRPFVYLPVTGDAVLDGKTKELALAFGIDHIVVDGSRPTDPERSIFCDATALTRGVPAITVESGALGRVDEREVETIVRGVTSVLRHLGVVDGEPAPVEAPIYFDRSEVLRSPAGGVLTPLVERGQAVAEGTEIVAITDFFGNEVARIRAPFAGIVLYVVATPPISQGEPVAMVAAPRR